MAQNRRFESVALIVMLACGCLGSGPPATKKPKEPDQAEQKPNLLKQRTQDIGKYDPKAGLKVSDSKVEITNPITGPLEAYGPMSEQVSKMGVDYNVGVFYAVNGRYPSYEEFMAEIIKKQNLGLPVLPGNTKKYQYDELNHKLVVVEVPEAKPEKKAD